MDSVGEGEGGKIWENGIETCVISCKKKKLLVHTTNNCKYRSEVQEREIHPKE